MDRFDALADVIVLAHDESSTSASVVKSLVVLADFFFKLTFDLGSLGGTSSV